MGLWGPIFFYLFTASQRFVCRTELALALASLALCMGCDDTSWPRGLRGSRYRAMQIQGFVRELGTAGVSFLMTGLFDSRSANMKSVLFGIWLSYHPKTSQKIPFYQP